MFASMSYYGSFDLIYPCIMAEGWKYCVVSISSDIILKYMFALPSAVTLTNKILHCNELQHEIYNDIMNINVDAAQMREGGVELLKWKVRYLPP